MDCHGVIMDHTGKRHETSMYNFGNLPPTQEMPAVEMKAALTVRDIVSAVIERDVEAWKALPFTVQDLLLSTPDKFRLHEFGPNGSSAGVKNLVPDLIYNNVRLRWDEANKLWRLYSIEK